MKLTIATCQFPVGPDARRNASLVRAQMRQAREAGANLAHFCESALSGYPGVDLPSFDGYDWSALEDATRGVIDEAARLGMWTVVGSTHRLTGTTKPHNAAYVIGPDGAIVDRYDKRFCAGDASGTEGELAHFTPGDHATVIDVAGVRCGVLICHEYRYPELYRDYRRQGVQVLLHSFHAGNVTPARLETMKAQVGPAHARLNRSGTLPGITMPAAMQAAAASSHIWISASNTSAKESCWGSFFVRADGLITGRLRRNTPGVLVSTVDTDEPLYDSTVAWRERAMRGVLHSGELARDARSAARTDL